MRLQSCFHLCKSDWKLLPVGFLVSQSTYSQLFWTCLTCSSHGLCQLLIPYVCVCVCLCVRACVWCISGSLAAGRWTAWPWRDRRTMDFPCRWTQSSYKPLGNWAGGPAWAPSLTTLSGNTGPISCSLPPWEVNTADRRGHLDDVI